MPDVMPDFVWGFEGGAYLGSAAPAVVDFYLMAGDGNPVRASSYRMLKMRPNRRVLSLSYS